jgi:erythromycin esterase
MMLKNPDMSETKFLLCLSFVCVAITAGCARVQSTEPDSFIEWASRNAVVIGGIDDPLSDPSLESLQSAVADSRLVGLGESRHDTREQLLLKKRLIMHLVEDMDFQAIFLEEDFAHTEALDRYITTGEGDIRSNMTGLPGWYLWDTEEMLGLIRWLRKVNQGRSPERMVHLYGMDITAPALGAEDVLGALEAAGIKTELDETALGLQLQQGNFWPTTWQRYSALTQEQRNGLAKNHEELAQLLKEEKSRLLSVIPQDDYQRLLLLGEVARMGNALFSSSNREQGGDVRERGMAQVVLRVLGNKPGAGKAIVWSHNLHIARSPFQMPGLAEGELIPMGFHLSEALGEGYLAFGGTFGTGSYPDSLPPGERIFESSPDSVMDGALAAVSVPSFFLDLRESKTDSVAYHWLGEPREWKAQDSLARMVPGTAFDLVYFVSEISRSQPTDSALQLFQSMSR